MTLRTCVGCRKEEEAGAMIRLVLGDDGALVVDLAGRSFGRSAWVHPRVDCLTRAARGGAAKSFKAAVKTDAVELIGAVRYAADRRVEALVSGARGAGRIAAGSDVSRKAYEDGKAALLVVASDGRATTEGVVLVASGASRKSRRLGHQGPNRSRHGAPGYSRCRDLGSRVCGRHRPRERIVVHARPGRPARRD